MKVLTVDIGGSHVKLLRSGEHEERRFDSGSALTPRQMMKSIQKITADWPFDRVSIGFPGLVVHDRIVAEPWNLGKGWIGFDFHKAFNCPVKIINDAAMQALGNYRSGRMLFLGLGTGLGTAMIVDGITQSMELAHLPYRHGKSYEDYLGERGLERLGKAKWRRHVWAVVSLMQRALEPDETVIGGGNAQLLESPPKGVRIGENSKAFVGGFRLWEEEPKASTRPRKSHKKDQS